MTGLAGRFPRKAPTALVVALTIALTGGLFTAASPASGASSKGPKQGGEITYGLEAETGGGWCPSTARLAISGIEVAAAIYDTLTAPNTKGEMVPYLAKSVTPNADFTQWTITLRDGITFHDGTPVDAAAIVKNLEAYRQALLVGAALKNIDTVTANGTSQVVVTTKTAWPEFPWFLYLDGRMPIVAPAQIDSGTCAENLIGSGPFMLAGPRVVNQSLVVERNPNYWQQDAKGNQLPYLDQITFVPVAEANQRVSGLQGGTLDVVHTSDGQAVDQLKQQASKFTLMNEKAGHREVRYLLLNANPAKEPLNDADARKAVAMAINRDQLNELRNNGIFTVANGPFDTKVLGYEKNPGFPKFSPKQAKQLADAYKAAHGGKFEVVLEHTNDPANVAEADLIKQQLAKVGIDATLKQDDQTAFITAAVTGNYSILLFRQHPGDDPDAQYQWWSEGSLLNFGKFADPQIQSLLDQGRASNDQAARKKIYQQLNERFASEVYNVWLYYSAWTIAGQQNVQGLAGPPLPDKGGQPLFLYGRHPLLGISLSQ